MLRADQLIGQAEPSLIRKKSCDYTFTKDEIHIALIMGINMIFPERKPPKSSKDRNDLLFLV
jgi:hypothetical protein